jgi:predicted dehydrogenase
MSAAAPLAARPLRVGFLGLGWIGRHRLQSLARLPSVVVSALADVNPAAVQVCAAEHPQAWQHTDLDALLACELDGIVIATPSAQHAEQAMAALAAGHAVFCQKPLATTAASALQVIEAASRADRLLSVDLCYRHVTGMSALRERIRRGELGRIQAIDLVFHNAYGPDKSWCMDRMLAGGGCVLDLGVHLIDLALWLQDFPESTLVSRTLYARGQRLAGGADEIEDLAFAELRQDDDACVRLTCSWHLHAGQDAIIGMRIHGTKGGAEWRNVNGSFYDFELDLLRGNSRERLGSYPDDWGSRAIQAWAQRAAHSPHFDDESRHLAAAARVIDQIYAPA